MAITGPYGISHSVVRLARGIWGPAATCAVSRELERGRASPKTHIT